MTVPRPLYNKKKCCVCDNITQPLFMFPKDNNRQLLWLKIIGKDEVLQSVDHTYIYNNARLCALHFKDEVFSSTLKKKLIKFAVPYRIENRNQTSLAESLDCSFENSSSLSESECTSVEKAGCPSSQIKVNSTGISSTVTNTASLNKISEKESFITNVSFITKSVITESLKFSTTSLNKVSENTPKICSAMKSLTTPEEVENPAVTVITLCCTDRKEGITFHKFLQDPKQRMRWISAVKSKNSKPTHISVLCPKHFNEEKTNNPSGLKENRVPNVFALDILNQQKDARFFQKWKDATPMDDGEVTSKDDFLDLHRNPKEIDKIFVKVMWDESVTKIAKRMQSSQAEAITSNVDARKKLKIDKICPSDLSDLPTNPTCSPQKDTELNCDELKKGATCSSSDTNLNNLSTLKHLLLTPTEELINHAVASKNTQQDTINSSDPNFSDPRDLPMHSPQTDEEEIVSQVDVRKNVKKDAICSSSTSNDLPYLKHLLQKPTEELVNPVIASKNSQKELMSSHNDTNPSDLPNLPLCLPQINSEEPASYADVGENLEKDAIGSSSDNSASTHPNFPMCLPMRTKKKLVLHARKKLKKQTACSAHIKNGKLMHSLNNSGVKIMGQNSISIPGNKEKVDSVNDSSGKVSSYCATDTIVKGRDLDDSSTQIESTDVIDSSDSINDIVEDRIDSNDSINDIVEDRIDSNDSINDIVEDRIDSNDSIDDIVEDRVDSNASIDDITEDRIDSNASIGDIAEDRIDSNNSRFDAEMEERTNVVHFPTIVNVQGGIDPFNLLELAERKKFIEVPNEWWTVSSTPKYLICLKLNEDYDTVFKVIIEKDYNVKVFIKGRECVSEKRKVSLENISALLQEVDSYEICAGVSDKSMTNCVGHLENGSEEPFSIWCKGCQRNGDEFMNRYKLLQELQ